MKLSEYTTKNQILQVLFLKILFQFSVSLSITEKEGVPIQPVVYNFNWHNKILENSIQLLPEFTAYHRNS